MRDLFTEQFIANLEHDKQAKRWKKRLVCIGIVTIILSAIIACIYILDVFADNYVELHNDNNGQYLYFEIDHKFVDAQYKYYGYGYTISLFDRNSGVDGRNGEFIYLNNGNEQGYQVFMPNDMLNSTITGNVEKVKIYIKEILKITGVPSEYFWSNGLTIYLNGRIGISVNDKLVHLYDSYEGNIVDGMPNGHKTGDYTVTKIVDGKKITETAPLNGDSCGIKNGIYKHYGINWSTDTQNNLGLNFNMHYDLDPPAKTDGYRVQYVEEKTGQEVYPALPSNDEYINATEDKKKLYPENIAGYKASGKYKLITIDCNNKRTDTSGTIEDYLELTNLQLSTTKPKRYIIIFYYDKETIIPPTGKYDKYRFVYVDKDTNKTISIGEFRSPNEETTVTVTPNIPTGYKFVDWRRDYVHEGYGAVTVENHHPHPEDKTKYDTASRIEIPIYEYTGVGNLYWEVTIRCQKDDGSGGGSSKETVCDPMFNPNQGVYNLNMKESEFNSTQVVFIDASLGINNLRLGYINQYTKVSGVHKHDTLDCKLYIDGKDGERLKESYDNQTTNNIEMVVGIPRELFTKVSDELWQLVMPVTYEEFCSCGGATFQEGTYTVNINIIQNKPPVANYASYTEVILEDKSIKVLSDIYANFPCTVENKATDPNGDDDIRTIVYTLTDESNNSYEIRLARNGDKYTLVSQNLKAANVEFIDSSEKADLLIEFKNTQTWKLEQLVIDSEGASDTYVTTIKPKALDLSPIAVISDILEYRYPVQTLLSGKQNRIMGVSSKNSYIANFLKGTGIKIDHTKDCIEIIPLDNQNISQIYFENNVNSSVNGSTLSIKGCDFTQQKLMLKEVGRYKIRLQVTDTNGNISKWAEDTITIVEDLPPTALATVQAKNYRDKTGVATITLQSILAKSFDNDIATVESISYKYDSDNDVSFDDEKAVKIDITKDKEKAIITTKNLGYYQFTVTVKEAFGQPTLEKYIQNTDYKTASTTFIAEVDNIPPQIIKFEIRRKKQN